VEIDKREHRAEAERRLRRLSSRERERFDQRICEAVLASELYRSCEQILLYIALADEVAVGAVREKAEDEGKGVFVPVSDSRGRSWSFRRWRSGARLRRGFGRVWEPDDGEAPGPAPGLCLIPGRAFTRQGHRLGRGHGCYDRLMSPPAELGATLGVAYECQIVTELPVESFDRSVEYLVTETGLSRCCPVLSGSRR